MLDSVIHGGSYLAEVVMAQFSLSGPHSFIYRAHHYPHHENKHSLRGSLVCAITRLGSPAVV